MGGIMENPDMQKAVRSLEQGTATTAWAAAAKEWEGKRWKYPKDCDVSPPYEKGVNKGYAKHTYNPEGRKACGGIRWFLVGQQLGRMGMLGLKRQSHPKDEERRNVIST